VAWCFSFKKSFVLFLELHEGVGWWPECLYTNLPTWSRINRTRAEKISSCDHVEILAPLKLERSKDDFGGKIVIGDLPAFMLKNWGVGWPLLLEKAEFLGEASNFHLVAVWKKVGQVHRPRRGSPMTWKYNIVSRSLVSIFSTTSGEGAQVHIAGGNRRGALLFGPLQLIALLATNNFPRS
jgi:hypothetical protein